MSRSSHAAYLGILSGVLGLACTEAARAPDAGGIAVPRSPLAPDFTPPPVVLPALSATVAAAGEARVAELLAVMREPVEGLGRAEKLFGLAESACLDPGLRAGVAHAVTRAQIAPDDPSGIRAAQALDLFELVATSCDRNHPAEARALCEAFAERLPSFPRIALVSARLALAHDDLITATREATKARDAGAVGAIALLAHLKAVAARAETSTAAMARGLAIAAEVVAAEPQPGWQLIDLTAVLSSRAHLLTELALWTEPGDAPRGLATALYGRLGQQPFIAATRGRALDQLCFEAPRSAAPDTTACARAAEEGGNLGGAFLAGLGLDPTRLDGARLAAIQGFEAQLAALPAGQSVALVARGDDVELVPWVRPTGVVLERFAAEARKVLFLDRTRSRSAMRLARRSISLSGAPMLAEFAAREEPLALGCVLALSTRGAPSPGCPLSEAERRLVRRHPVGALILVGRDLAPEVEDATKAAIPYALLSIRQLPDDKPAAVHLKSASDAWLLARDAAALAGRFAPRSAR